MDEELKQQIIDLLVARARKDLDESCNFASAVQNTTSKAYAEFIRVATVREIGLAGLQFMFLAQRSREEIVEGLVEVMEASNKGPQHFLKQG